VFGLTFPRHSVVFFHRKHQFALSPKEIQMPTTTQIGAPALWSRTKRREPFVHIGFGILTVWAVIMLSIGAAAQFGMQAPELSTLEYFTLF
jgi:hypothetical protein